MTVTNTHIGPSDYLVVEFPGIRFKGEIAAALLDAVDRGLIDILDLVVLRKGDDGEVAAVELSDVPIDEVAELAELDCSLAGLLTTDDIAEVGAALEPGTTAGIVVWENRWAAPLTAAVDRAGGVVAAGGRVDLAVMLASLEAADSTPD